MHFVRYDRIASHYAAMWPLVVPGHGLVLNAMQEVVRVMAKAPREVLDLGCGPGSATLAVWSGCATDCAVTLVDGSRAMLDVATALLGERSRSIIHGDFTEPRVSEMIFGPERYQLILCSFALHHLDDQLKRQTVERLAYSLAPGGLLLLADEVVTDRPSGWGVVEQVRSHIVHDHLQAGRIDRAFWELETSLPAEYGLPLRPARVEDLTSWMARGGLAVSCPVVVFGSALLLGLKPVLP